MKFLNICESKVLDSISVFVFSALTFCLSTNAGAQDAVPVKAFPEIGKKCPELELSDISFFYRKQASLTDFQNKWLVLDFFTTGCTACFESLPKINQLQKAFKDQVQVMMVGWDDGILKSVYEKFRTRNNLELSVAYDKNGTLFKELGIVGVPHILVLDGNGIVRAITNKITADNIGDFLAGRDPGLLKKFNAMELEENKIRYTPSKPLLLQNNGGKEGDFLYRSVLTNWNGDIVGGNQTFVTNVVGYGDVKIKGRIQVVGYSLGLLYYMAYADTIYNGPIVSPNSYGAYWSKPILEVKDSKPFESNSSEKENLYNYSLIVPEQRSTARYLQEVMRRDLMNYFGYSVEVKQKVMPYWKLVAKDGAKSKLATQGNLFKKKKFPPRTGFSLGDQPVSKLVEVLFLCFPDEAPFIDETGIEGNIDVIVEALQTDLNDMKRGLQSNGLDLIKGEKPMTVVVIKDSQ